MSDEFVPYLKGDLDARQHRIYNLPDPVDNNEVATKGYVDAGGGGSQPTWEAVTVPTDAASWDTLDTPATCLADTAPTLPLVIVLATNDTFAYQHPNFPGEVFTLASGVYTTIGQAVAAMAAAVGESAERFDTLVTPSNSSGSILLTSLAPGGVASGAYAITEGNGGAAALGFTGNPDIFANGYGGTWTFADGVITSPAQTTDADSVILSDTDNFGQAWAVECQVKVASATTYAFAFTAAAWVYQAASLQELDGSGFQATDSPRIDVCLFGDPNPTCNTAIPDTDWHTIRAVNLPLVQQLYFDGTLVGQAFIAPNSEQSDGLKESRFLFWDGIGGTMFRNLNAWRIPLPVFP